MSWSTSAHPRAVSPSDYLTASAPARKTQVVGAEIALERGCVRDLSPWESPAATTQRVDAAAQDIHPITTVNASSLTRSKHSACRRNATLLASVHELDAVTLILEWAITSFVLPPATLLTLILGSRVQYHCSAINFDFANTELIYF